MHQTKRLQPTCKAKQLDKYYTKPLAVRHCIDALFAANLDHEYDLVIEPSAGAGAFLHAFPHKNKIGMDIDPEHCGITRQDWLAYIPSPKYRSILVIGNPPFGQYHSLSTAFIHHAMRYANVQTVAFVLPNVYKKYTRQRVIAPGWRIANIAALPRNSFTLLGEDYHVPSAFFIFDYSQGKDLRCDPNKYSETKDFTFGRSDDFDIFVFGASPKKITKYPTANNRGHYLKSKISVDRLIDRIKSVDWVGCSAASGGVYWLTKYELLEQYNNRY